MTVTKPNILCRECGRILCWINAQHLAKHKMSTDDYKEKYKIPYGEGLTTVELKSLKSKRQYRLMEENKIVLIQFTKGCKPPTRRRPPNIKELHRKQSLLMQKRYREHPENFKKFIESADGFRKPCSICSHKNKNEVEKLIQEGLSEKKISERFRAQFSESSIWRHRVNCLGIKLPEGKRRTTTKNERKCEWCKKKFSYYGCEERIYNRKFCCRRCYGNSKVGISPFSSSLNV